jgi:hypothetical protein
MRKWLLGLMLSLSGCMGGATDSNEPVKEVRDTVYIRDTIYMNPPVPGAPTIKNLTQKVYPEEFDFNLVYIDWNEISGSIGYNVYKAPAAEGPYQVVTSGKSGSGYGAAWKSAIGSLDKGLVFFKVSAVNNNGIEGPMSPHRAIIYDGP